MGVIGYQEYVPLSLFIVGFHVTQLRTDGPGVDLYLGTLPRALAAGTLFLAPRASVTWPVPIYRDSYLLPAGGVTGAVGEGFLVGASVGLSLLTYPGGSGPGVRAGVSQHWFRDAGGALWLVEFGITGRRGDR